MLSRRGKKVLVLEQHDIAGGCTHTFTSSDTHDINGFEFDTGIHYVGGDVGSSKSLFGYLFHQLSVGFLKWSKLSPQFDSAGISPSLASQLPTPVPTAVTNVPIVESSTSCFESAAVHFPEEQKAIQSMEYLYGWVDLCLPIMFGFKLLPYEWIRPVLEQLSRWLSPLLASSTHDIIQQCTKNKDLMGLFTYAYGDYGLSPKRSSFVLHALLSLHFRSGAYYPTGGSSEIAHTMISMIQASGGNVMVRAPVSEILLDEITGRVRGVRVR